MGIRGFLRKELTHLLKVNTSDRPWEMPLAASLAIGLPLLLTLYWGHLEYGLTASLGGLVFLYMPNTKIEHRMVFTMACAFGMIASYALGLLGHFMPELMAVAIIIIATLVTMTCRYYALGPPGSLFFVMVSAIGIFSPITFSEVPAQVGLVSLGCLWACAIGFLYSLYILRKRPSQPIQALPKPTFDFVVFDSVVIGIFVGISLVLAQLFQLDRPYWVPVSCLAVIQGVTFRAAWTRQIHRVIGTIFGLSVTWLLLSLHFSLLNLCLVMMGLIFIIESLVVRHYGLAAIFITPLTIFLAEMTSFGMSEPSQIIQSRLIDTFLGCLVGIVGAAFLHNESFRARSHKLLKSGRHLRF
ncbi:FUSC family protein [Polynucleobacter sp. 71A-WALBACH]|uniref:FUSC family protein n=1 Tax=Polynucleobacter sp. 71A-WALBACH TaxID=2689097 RepID=UPI001C0B686B|nr:FUSC family protein [Polynucleobacter sp. 71A-WALBACH]MBU3594756.1 FUSC family protein [Polynucleobacter sp. 71A-WALBACH]